MGASVNFSNEKRYCKFPFCSIFLIMIIIGLFFAYPDGHTIRLQKDTGRLNPVNWSNDERFIRGLYPAQKYLLKQSLVMK